MSKRASKRVTIVMGSANDLPVVEKAIDVLKRFEVPCDVHVMSAHRTPNAASAFASRAAESGVGVIIAAAGKAAHLAGAMAANTIVPVIGLPIKGSDLGGLDALLSTVQMPAGVPVATVGINAAENAALLAVQILALGDDALCSQLWDERRIMMESVAEADMMLQAKLHNF